MKIYGNNKKATFDYEILEEYTAGICLTGSEICSLMKENNTMNFTGSFVSIMDNKVTLIGSNIKEYKNRNTFLTHSPDRPRVLLLNKSEIRKLSLKLKVNGLTIVPLKAYKDETSRKVKITIALVKGKTNYDKRESIKEKDEKRAAERE